MQEAETFDKWLAGLDLSFWGTAQHKVTPAQFFERQQNEDAVLLDLRSCAETDYLSLPFALHIPIHDLPQRWSEVPTDRLVVTFCSSGVRSAVAFAYLQFRGLTNVRILEGGYNGLTAEFKPGRIHKRNGQ